MKIKKPISKWLEIAEGLEYLARKDDMPKVPAWRLALLYPAVASMLAKYHELRNDLIKKLGDEKEGNFSVPAAKLDEFRAEIEPLLAEEFEVEYEPISLALLKEVTIRPAVFVACRDLFTE